MITFKETQHCMTKVDKTTVETKAVKGCKSYLPRHTTSRGKQRKGSASGKEISAPSDKLSPKTLYASESREEVHAGVKQYPKRNLNGEEKQLGLPQEKLQPILERGSKPRKVQSETVDKNNRKTIEAFVSKHGIMYKNVRTRIINTRMKKKLHNKRITQEMQIL